MRARRAASDNHFLAQWLILVIGVLLLGATAGASLLAEHRRIELDERERLRTLARVADQNIARQIDGANRALEAVREDFVSSRPDAGGALTIRSLETLCDAMPGVRTMLITDASGSVIAANRRELIGKDVSSREYFSTPRQRPDPATLYVSPPFETMLHVLGMTVTRVITRADGTFAGVVTATLDPEYFSILLASVLYRDGMWAALAHGDGAQFVMVPEREGQARGDLVALFEVSSARRGRRGRH